MVAGPAIYGQSPSAPDPEALLEQIRLKATGHLAELPNYTCHESISRIVQWLDGSNRMQRDSVELQVAFIGNRELFAYAGASEIRERSIIKLVPRGTIGSGTFGAIVSSIFSGDAVRFQFAGTQKRDHHRTYRYDFEVPPENSKFAVRHGAASAIVGYRGSLWADSETLDLVSVEIKADRLPSELNLRYIAEGVHYGKVQIAGADVLLPVSSQLEAADIGAVHSVDLIRLDGCREYSAKSSVAFGKAVDGEADRQSDPGR